MSELHIPCRPNLSASIVLSTRIQDSLRRIAAEKRTPTQGFAVSESTLRLAAGIERLAAVIGAADLEDPRLIALAVTGRVTSEPGTWNPGPEQRRVLAGIGRTQLGAERASAHDLDAIFSEFAVAGVEDVYATLTTKATILEQERDRLRDEIAKLKPRAQRTDDAELALKEATDQHTVDLASAMRQARMDAFEPQEPVSLDEPEELPTGVRRHGSGFQAYRRHADGKQRAKTFKTVEQAVQWREQGIERVAA